MIGIAENYLTHMREKQNRTLLPLGRIGFWLSSPPAGEAENYLTHMREKQNSESPPLRENRLLALLPAADQYRKQLTCEESKNGISSLSLPRWFKPMLHRLVRVHYAWHARTAVSTANRMLREYANLS
jgi:uncharacterized short protein YbdD (DUF466 family)